MIPDPGRWWNLVEKYGVTILYTAPTAIRGLMRYGDEWPAKYDLSQPAPAGLGGRADQPRSLDVVPPCGRRPPARSWTPGGRPRPARILISPDADHAAQARLRHPAVPRHRGRRGDKEGKPVAANKGGYPGDPPALAVDDAHHLQRPRALRDLLEHHPRRLLRRRRRAQGRRRLLLDAGPGGRRDQDRPATAWAAWRSRARLVSHPAVAEAAVIGKPDELTGERIKAFVILRKRLRRPATRWPASCKQHVRDERRAASPCPTRSSSSTSLPKTRSGKIMRRLLRAHELGEPIGDTSTLED